MAVYPTIRPFLFALPAELAHALGKQALSAVQSNHLTRAVVQRKYRYHHPTLEIDRFGIQFPTPVGIAAGFDKNGEVVPALSDLGFGFVEVGTVTPYPQSGNPKPRLFRLPEDAGLINRLGFNSQGADQVRRHLDDLGEVDIPFGVNLGKMNESGEDQAIADYRYVLNQVGDHPDYVVVNISCPNTPDEFDEGRPGHLRRVFDDLQEANQHHLPLLVKVSPDGDDRYLENVIEVAEEFDLAGFIATNTTTDDVQLDSKHRSEWGGISGRPLEERATSVIRTLFSHTDLPIIGVGGVRDAETAYRKIRNGASLVQLYTGFVYQGPSVANRINCELVDLLHRDGFDSVEEAIGVDVGG